MTFKDFDIVEKAFQKALTLEDSDRQDFLKAFGEKHPKLSATLLNLLEADANASDTLADAVSTSIRTLADGANDPWIGREIGVWKIKSRLGAGGMGAVFLADRIDEQFAQTVAIKILGSQLLDKNAAIRFRTERQILANLNHPHIATLIDGGVTDTDLPYLVMEHIDGVRIDEYCDTNSLSITERIGLFKTVCDSVDYAHRNLIVHCDLKPSNILVTRNGTVKLLDFGIAKLIEPESYEMTIALTAAGARVMTPEYASPEQVRGQTVSVSTDIYALGVLLFRLLTGRSPYGNEFTTAHEIQSAILDKNPKRPSTIVSETTIASMVNTPSSPDDLSSLRGTTVERLRKKLAGDLDTIILKCLQKEPERRYQAPRDLAADLTHYLRHEPIAARSDSWLYKTKKFVRRNTGAAMASAAVLGMTISLVSFYTLRLADERDKAQLAAAEANQVSDFLRNIFNRASPREDEGTPITARDLLGEANQKIGTLEGQGKLKASLYYTVGESQFWLGEYDQAKDSYSKAVEYQLGLSPQPIESIVRTYLGLADVEQVQDNYAASDVPLKNAFDFAIANFGENHKVTAHVLARMAATEGGKYNNAEALVLFERAQRALDASGEQDDKVQLEILGNSMIYYGRLGRSEESANVGRRALKLSEKVLGPLDPDTIIRTTNLASSVRRLWKLEEADKLYRLAVERAAIVYPKMHPQHRNPLTPFAINLELLGKFDEAKSVREKETELSLLATGKESSAYGFSRLGLARWHQQRGNLYEAAQRFEIVLNQALETNKDSDFFPNLCRLFLAETYNEMGDHVSADPLLTKAGENRRVFNEGLNFNLDIQRATVLLANGRRTEAEKIINQWVERKDETGAESGPNIVYPFVDFAIFYRQAGQLDKAEQYARRAHEAGQKELPQGNWILATASSELAQVLAAQGKQGEAREIAGPAYQDLLTTFGPDDYRVLKLKPLL